MSDPYMTNFTQLMCTWTKQLADPGLPQPEPGETGE